jgi:hypothetical protein
MERDAVVALTVRGESRTSDASVMITNASGVLRGAVAGLVTRPACSSLRRGTQHRCRALCSRALRAHRLEEPCSFPLGGSAFRPTD